MKVMLRRIEAGKKSRSGRLVSLFAPPSPISSGTDVKKEEEEEVVEEKRGKNGFQ